MPRKNNRKPESQPSEKQMRARSHNFYFRQVRAMHALLETMRHGETVTYAARECIEGIQMQLRRLNIELKERAK